VYYSPKIERARNFACGLQEFGIDASQASSVGIYLPNCVEWVIAEQAVNATSMILVPMYDTLPLKQVCILVVFVHA